MFAVFKSVWQGKYYRTAPAKRQTVDFADVWKKLLFIGLFELHLRPFAL